MCPLSPAAAAANLRGETTGGASQFPRFMYLRVLPSPRIKCFSWICQRTTILYIEISCRRDSIGEITRKEGRSLLKALGLRTMRAFDLFGRGNGILSRTFRHALLSRLFFLLSLQFLFGESFIHFYYSDPCFSGLTMQLPFFDAFALLSLLV